MAWTGRVSCAPLLMVKSEGGLQGLLPEGRACSLSRVASTGSLCGGVFLSFLFLSQDTRRLGLWPSSRPGDERRLHSKPFAKSSPPPVTMVGHNQGKRAQSRQRARCSSEMALGRHARAFVP